MTGQRAAIRGQMISSRSVDIAYLVSIGPSFSLGSHDTQFVCREVVP
jgi:hypothetical protein